MANTGNGSTVVFATSGFTAKYIEIGGMNESIPVLDNSGLSTTGHAEKCPGDLIDHDAITLRYFYAPNARQPLTGVVETATFTLAPIAGQTVGATLSGTGFFSSRTGPTLANNQIWEGQGTWQFDGNTGPTYTSGS